MAGFFPILRGRNEPVVPLVCAQTLSPQPEQPERPRSVSTSSGGSDTDSSDSDSPSVVEESLASALDKSIVTDPNSRPGQQLYQHIKNGTLHWTHLNLVSRFECKRILSKSYKRVRSLLKFDWPVCHQCKGH